MWLIVVQFQLQGGCVSNCWAPTSSSLHGRSPKETLTAICSSTTAHQVGGFFLCRQRELRLNFDIFGGDVSHYGWSVRKDYAIYFLSEHLWRDYTLERCGGFKFCPAPLPSLRQRSFFAAANLKIGLRDTWDIRNYTGSWWGSVQTSMTAWMTDAATAVIHSALNCTTDLWAWWTPDILHLSGVDHCTDTRCDLVSFCAWTV